MKQDEQNQIYIIQKNSKRKKKINNIKKTKTVAYPIFVPIKATQRQLKAKTKREYILDLKFSLQNIYATKLDKMNDISLTAQKKPFHPISPSYADIPIPISPGTNINTGYAMLQKSIRLNISNLYFFSF